MIINFDTVTLIFIFILIEYIIYNCIKSKNDTIPDWDRKCIWKTKVKKLVKVVDGDTFTAFVDGHHPIDNKPIGIRIRGIDTPEMKSTDEHTKRLAIEAKEVAMGVLTKSRKIVLYNVSLNDKYGRMLATVFCDGIDLAKLLLNRGLAKPYFGGTKEDWD